MNHFEDILVMVMRHKILKKTNNKSIIKAFIARDSNGKLFLYHPNPPIKVEEEWIQLSASNDLFKIDDDLFPEVKWSDEEPTKVKLVIER